MTTGPALLEMRAITKHYPGVLANDQIDFTVNRGEIHSLLGENGAGKTTLMNILYGLTTQDSGEVLVNGGPARIHSPADAIRMGIGMVHQHFMLIERLTVVENVVLHTRPAGYPLYDRRAAARTVGRLIQQYGFDLDPLVPIEQLSVGQQQRVEILKALYRRADLLILDEPTAVLTPAEVKDLFRLLSELRGAGHGIIFISHKLNETLENSDRITVLRQGRVAGTVLPRETNQMALARMMVGRNVLFDIPLAPYAGDQPVVLDVQDLHVLDDRRLEAVRGVSLKVCAGQIVGIAGVDGNGQKEFIEAITGLRRVASGRVHIGGIETTHFDPGQVLRQDVAHIPEDRQRRGLVLPFRVEENLVLHNPDRPPFARRGLLQPAEITRHANEAIALYDIRPPQPALRASQLSGGNQQKVVLARELAKRPRLVIAMQPTRGLDVGATEYVRQKLVEARNAGAAVLLVSTELDEVLSISDVIAVLYGGEIAGQMVRSAADIGRIGLLMGGARGE